MDSRYLILLLIASYQIVIAAGRETLIIVDKSSNIATFKQSHSELLNLIQDLKHTPTIKSADDATLKLTKYGDYLYENILILCPQLDMFRGSLNYKDFLDFVDSGRNLLVAGGNTPGSVISDLAEGVGFEFKELTSKRDYTNVKLNNIYHIVGDAAKYASFSYSGTQLKMVKSELSIEILSNSAPVDDIRPSSTEALIGNVLIGAMQARNNARVIVSGSLDFYADKAFASPMSGNKALTKELLMWLFKEKSVLRHSEVRHRMTAPGTESQSSFEGYTIMDDIEYGIKIEIYEAGKWSPYLANDVQLEFVRIDPFVRQTMVHKEDGTYLAKFKVPDVYGVYKFQVDYQKDGLTRLFSSSQVSVRPLRHDQYERFIYSAFPYYLSAFMMMAYLYVFSFVYLNQSRSNK